MDKTNYLLSGLEDMDKVIVFLNRESGEECHTRKMVFRKEEKATFQATEIFKIDGYISRFDNDLQENYLLLNVPDVWFWNDGHTGIAREEDFDLIFIPKQAVGTIKPALETVLKRFVKEMKEV